MLLSSGLTISNTDLLFPIVAVGGAQVITFFGEVGVASTTSISGPVILTGTANAVIVSRDIFSQGFVNLTAATVRSQTTLYLVRWRRILSLVPWLNFFIRNKRVDSMRTSFSSDGSKCLEQVWTRQNVSFFFKLLWSVFCCSCQRADCDNVLHFSSCHQRRKYVFVFTILLC